MTVANSHHTVQFCKIVFIFCSIPTFYRWKKSRKRLQTSLHTQPHISNRLYLLAAAEAHLEGVFSSVILVWFVLNVKMVMAGRRHYGWRTTKGRTLVCSRRCRGRGWEKFGPSWKRFSMLVWKLSTFGLFLLSWPFPLPGFIWSQLSNNFTRWVAGAWTRLEGRWRRHPWQVFKLFGVKIFPGIDFGEPPSQSDPRHKTKQYPPQRLAIKVQYNEFF